MIQVEQLDGDLADGRQSNNACSVQDKMIVPLLRAWIEEPHHGPSRRINRPQISSFRVIALGASIGQILAHCLPAVPEGNNVIKLVCIGRVVLMDQTILTTVTSSFTHQTAQRDGNAGAWHQNLSAAS